MFVALIYLSYFGFCLAGGDVWYKRTRSKWLRKSVRIRAAHRKAVEAQRTVSTRGRAMSRKAYDSTTEKARHGVFLWQTIQARRKQAHVKRHVRDGAVVKGHTRKISQGGSAYETRNLRDRINGE